MKELTLNEFAGAMKRSNFLVAHNMNFDDKIVGAEFLRTGFKNRLTDIPKICTMKISTDYCKLPGPYGYKLPSLSELHYKLFEEYFDEAHDAAVDVRACANCFFELKERGVIGL